MRLKNILILMLFCVANLEFSCQDSIKYSGTVTYIDSSGLTYNLYNKKIIYDKLVLITSLNYEVDCDDAIIVRLTNIQHCNMGDIINFKLIKTIYKKSKSNNKCGLELIPCFAPLLRESDDFNYKIEIL